MVDLELVRQALALVRDQCAPTPLLHSEHFSEVTGARVHLKLENLQRTGSFKVRGALFKLARCRDRIGPLGVVAASAGNHAQGVALAAGKLGVAATIVMPEGAAVSKQVATRDYGAEVILRGRTVADALDHALTLAEEGLTFVHPYDDDDVIAGQGTVGLEILEQTDDVDEVWVPVGGGGLAAGIAAAVKGLRPRTRVVGIQAAACPSAVEAMKAGGPVTVRPDRSLADGILVPRVGERTFPLLSRHLDELVLVEEDRIAMAVVQLLERKKLLSEGAGAVALAALLSAGPDRVRGRSIVAVVSGGNLDLSTLDRILEAGLIRTGRILRFRVILDDVPGSLATLLTVLAAEKANILTLDHDRLAADLPLGRTRVEVAVETRGGTHSAEILSALESAGFGPTPLG